MNRTRIAVALASAVLAGAIVFAGAVVSQRSETGRDGARDAGRDAGTAASAFDPTVPAFDLPSVAGSARFRSADYTGRPLVINVFDYTCVPCVRELPMIDAMAAAHTDVAFLGVHLLLGQADAAAFVRRLGISFPVAYDGEGVFAAAVLGLPTTIFISPDGREVGRVTGAIAKADLQDRLQRLEALVSPVPQGIS